MKVEITKRQLEAIAEIATTLDSMLGCSEPNDIDVPDFDTVVLRELKIIQRFYKKNGYALHLIKR